MQYKKFILKSFLLLVPIFAIVFVVNIKIDSGMIINHRSEAIAKILVSGENAAIKTIPNDWGNIQISIVNERKKLKEAKRKDVMVFGTSRSAEINSSLFPGKTFFNCAVAGGNILDYIALYNLYKQNNLLPKYLFISIDPWTFHARKSISSNKGVEYISDSSAAIYPVDGFRSNFNAGAKRLHLNSKEIEESSNIQQLFEMFSPKYLQLNINSFNDEIVLKTKENFINSYFIIKSDGSYSLAEQEYIDSNKVIKQANSFYNLQKHNFFLAGDTKNIYFLYFKKLVWQLKKDGVVPIIYISPINPILYPKFSTNGNVPLEDSIVAFCKESNVAIVGSFNPFKYGFKYTSNFFIDQYHPVQSVIDTIFKFHHHQMDSIIGRNDALNN